MHLGVLSNRNLTPEVFWSAMGPALLEPLAAKHNARLIAPPRIAFQNHSEWRRALKGVGSADTLFWMQLASRPEVPLFLASLLAGFARRSAFIVDAWRVSHTKIGILALLQRLDPCFIVYREAYLELGKRFPSARFEWMPLGVDTGIFNAEHGERPIFAYSMGRRHEPLHQALIRYCSDRGLKYEHSNNGEIKDPFEVGRRVGRSQYFLVTPPNLPNPSRTQGYSPLTMRFFEGLSAGARLIGVLPGSGEYEMLLPLDAILQVAPDGSDLAAKLDADRNNPDARPAVERARLFVREHHSWTRRAGQIYGRLETGKPTEFENYYSDTYLRERPIELSRT